MVRLKDFSKLDLRVGKILEVADHPQADKLYVLKVDIGEEVVGVVAGIKDYYSPSDLENKLIVVLTNLEPKILRGVESQGMLLAAQANNNIAVLTPDKDINPGSVVR